MLLTHETPPSSCGTVELSVVANQEPECPPLRSFTVRVGRWPQDEEAVRELRTQVFVEEQGVPAEIERDGRDPQCLHVVAESDSGRLIGTARLLPAGQIGRMAVARAWRRRGVGAALLDALLRLARERDMPEPFLHAQAGAVSFYENRGFKTVGPPFFEAGIEHRKMILDAPQQQPPK